MGQDYPNIGQDDPKTAPTTLCSEHARNTEFVTWIVGTNLAPIWICVGQVPQGGPKMGQDDPTMGQDDPKMGQDDPKMAPMTCFENV
jgi:hypothetical protein